MSNIKVLLVSSEAAPFVKVGGLADVVGALPRTLVQQGIDARVILPLYKKIKQSQASRLQFMGWRMVKMGWRSLYAGLFSLKTDDGVTYYFVDNEYYFNYDQVYVEYSFDIERYCFFQRAVLDFLGEPMQFEPDVLHCNDWQTGMIPLLLEAHFKSYGHHQQIKTVFTIHNLKYQGVHGLDTVKEMLDLPDRYLTDEFVLKDGAVNFMKTGIVFSNSVTTVSPTYAYEIMTDYYGEGLNGVLQRFAYKVTGILNGIDNKEFNPSVDPLIPKQFSFPFYGEGKAVCKASIQRQLGLDENPGAPLCVMISRLVDQKGMDLFIRVLDEMLFDGMQVVILGTGDVYYEHALVEIAKRNPKKMCACISFDNGLAHTLYAGADIYLMPSLFEPCGLSQMIAMAYGTIPVVRETGGLKDTVTPYNEYTSEGNGFTFTNINAHEFLFATKYACDLYRNRKDIWDGLIRNAMTGDYSWDRSAREYAGLFSLITGIPFEHGGNPQSPFDICGSSGESAEEAAAIFEREERQNFDEAGQENGHVPGEELTKIRTEISEAPEAVSAAADAAPESEKDPKSEPGLNQDDPQPAAKSSDKVKAIPKTKAAAETKTAAKAKAAPKTDAAPKTKAAPKATGAAVKPVSGKAKPVSGSTAKTDTGAEASGSASKSARKNDAASKKDNKKPR